MLRRLLSSKPRALLLQLQVRQRLYCLLLRYWCVCCLAGTVDSEIAHANAVACRVVQTVCLKAVIIRHLKHVTHIAGELVVIRQHWSINSYHLVPLVHLAPTC